ncbi:uncharacterized protein LOC106180010 isoform X2 [Lingula anatina]|uniref:Uncharacterized protein LOC106180010 isoform X2 n=2 Tax=Lingula anatina TaxID=7574 RepID=A0A1S3K9Z5_LINAN|nr:uncharacterized protein LOC106180010 isoform X2 [Lingula anatina]|eukprot:XP_013419322.1 uncharacterized protein LOC106180010 isoform X2 [Lingula anatina]
MVKMQSEDNETPNFDDLILIGRGPNHDAGMMEKAGLAGWSSEKMQQWFADVRQTPRYQAEYLGRLSKLREELINQEQENLSHAMERLRVNSLGREHPKHRAKIKKPPDEFLDTFPYRQRQILLEKLERNRRRAGPVRQRSPPKLDPLEGKQLVEPFHRPERNTNSAPELSNKSKSDGDLHTRLFSKSVDEAKLVNLQKLLKPSQSIPNLERRIIPSRHQTNKQSPAHKDKMDLTVHPEAPHGPIYKKDAQTGLFKRVGARAVSRQPKAHLELAPTAHSYDRVTDVIDAVRQAQEEYHVRGQFYVPSTTPESDFQPTEDPYRDCVDSDWTGFSSSGGSHRLVKYPNEEETSRGVSRKGNKRSDTELSRDRTLEAKMKAMSRSHEIVASYTEFPRIPPEKKSLIVEMPNIVFQPATPDLYSVYNDLPQSSQSLKKAYRQQQLREREVSNLLEDVQELNQITEELQTKVLERQASKFE